LLNFRFTIDFMASSLSSPVQIRCKGVLFDMDGILISSLGSVERSWTKWSQSRGIDPAYAMTLVHGRRAIETVAALRPDLDSEAELKVIEDIEIADNEELSVLPGVMDLLAELPTNRWTVVTSATVRLARVRLAQAGIPVPERLVTAESVSRGKPDPAPYLAGAAILGFAPEECVVFEDAASGTKAGRAAGCTVIATTFSHPIEQLEDAHYLIEDVTGVRAKALPGDEGVVLSFRLLED
jgi:sugar-phosphatase